MKRFSAMKMLLGGFASALLLAGCGGGGGSSQSQALPPTGSASVFVWSAPSTFKDNSPLDPSTDVAYYELYLRTDPNFTDSDQPAVQIAAMAEVPSPNGRYVVKSPVTEYTLELIPSIPAGNLLYVSMRAVGIDKQKSELMAPVAWDRS
jgi:hypothetical protein